MLHHSTVTVLPRDTYHIRAYLAPLGLWLVAEAGSLASVSLSLASRRVTVLFESSAAAAAAAGMSRAPYELLRLRFEQAAPGQRGFSFSLAEPAGASLVRGAWAFAPNGNETEGTEAVIAF